MHKFIHYIKNIRVYKFKCLYKSNRCEKIILNSSIFQENTVATKSAFLSDSIRSTFTVSNFRSHMQVLLDPTKCDTLEPN